jgi:hypothetical protein
MKRKEVDTIDTIRIIPITLKTANNFVTKHHRHHSKAQGCKFCVGVVDDNGLLRGVAIVGRPVSRFLDNGLTAEVTRLCTDGYKNACSFLYSACARIAKLMGFDRIITYILAAEKGTSLKASGWIRDGICGGGNWNVPSRPRKNSAYAGKKVMYSKNLC